MRKKMIIKIISWIIFIGLVIALIVGAINIYMVTTTSKRIISVDDAKKYIAEGQFAPGSMLPKVQAAVDFASSKEGRTAMITLLQKAKDGIQGKTGTKIHL
mgnify:CR=1 FL=1